MGKVLRVPASINWDIIYVKWQSSYIGSCLIHGARFASERGT